MIPEAPFLFSIGGINASLAGLAGLVVGLRRGTDMRALDTFRLRQIVEFAFANVLLAVSVVPLSLILGSTERAVRLAGIVALGYALLSAVYLARRSRREHIPWTVGWTAGVAMIDIALLLFSVAAIATASIGWYEALLVALLARPMFAFLLVIARLGERDP